jgi:hypothetical protein
MSARRTGFLSEGILPRAGQIFRHGNFWTALGALATSLLGLSLLELPSIAPSIKIEQAMTMVVTFTTMGFGVSITALALILALPLNRAIALTMVNSSGAPLVDVSSEEEFLLARNPGTGEAHLQIPGHRLRSGYLDLVFIFIWTAMLNVLAAVAAITATVVAGNDDVLTSDQFVSHLAVSTVVGLSVYAAMQMGTALVTIFQLAKLFQNLSLQQIERNARRSNLADSVDDPMNSDDNSTAVAETAPAPGWTKR